MSAADATSPIDRLARLVADEPDVARRLEVLVTGLADAIKATSNDQNVQRLSRELRAAAPGLTKAALSVPVEV